MRAAFSFHRLFTLLCLMVLSGGCLPKSKKETEESRLEEQMAEREKQLTFMKKNCDVDWRKRVEAASEALAQAKSDSRWGRKDEALKNALEAAKLMPPPSKDFDSPSPAKRRQSSGANSAANSSSSADGNQSGGGADGGSVGSAGGSAGGSSDSASGGGTSPAEGGSETTASAGSGSKNGSGSSRSGGPESGSKRGDGGTADQESAGSGPNITNAEVKELRESLEALLKALDGKAGKSKSGLSFERDAIEIR